MSQAENLTIQPVREGGLMWFVALSGFLPVLSIVMHCAGLMPLRICLLAIVLPAFGIVTVFGIKIPALGRVMLLGWAAGVIAVALYDISRVPFILFGWSDFIPKIGAWLTTTRDPDPLIGYLWRYVGNGGGMGTAFFVLLYHFQPAIRFLFIGLVYGLGIFVSLMCVLVVFKEAQEMMFRITPFTFTGSLIGHGIYGLALGTLAIRFKLEIRR